MSFMKDRDETTLQAAKGGAGAQGEGEAGQSL